MNVLVTGGAGLIGMQVRQTLAQAGHTVLPVDVTSFGRDDPALMVVGLDDAEQLEALVIQREIDSIVHCGAISGPMMARGEPMLIFDVNVAATARLLDLARRRKMKRFIFCSSISVYGDVGPGLISEATELHPTSVYGASKVACEALVEGFASEYGVDGTSLRISRVYGPYRRANCHIGNIIRDAQAGRTTQIPCDPAFVYHYVYVEDVAEAILRVLEAPHLPHRAYNVGAARSHYMPEIAMLAKAAIAGAKVTLVDGADDVPDVQEAFDISLIRRETGWQPRFDLVGGLTAYRETIIAGNAVQGD